jgi:peptide chain release factor 1
VSAGITGLVEQIERTRDELQTALAEPALANDRTRYADVNRRWSSLAPAIGLVERWRDAAARVAEATEWLTADDDDDVRELLREAQEEMDALEPQIREALVEHDPNDDKDVIVEIRAAAGGEEAALFARQLLEIYLKYAERRGFRTEQLSVSPADAGGVKDVTVAIKGAGAYSVYKHEAGVHRVQRVPETESQGRIHTSTATVAVLPEAEDVDVNINPNDLKIDVYRSSGPGGQSVNTTDSAVRLTHVPTGIVVSMQDEKSQLQNRERGMRVLRARLYERAMAEQAAVISSARREQLGSGDRAEKVRTYNYPQNRVTDHRVGLTVQLRESVLQGDLDDLTSALAAEERRQLMEAHAAGGV